MKTAFTLLVASGLFLAGCGDTTATPDSASANPSGKSSGAPKAQTSTSAAKSATPAPATSATPPASGSAATPAASGSADPDACPPDNKAPAFEYAENVKFTWSQEPKLADAPKDKSYANVGGKTFVLPKVEVWISEERGEIDLRTNDGVLLGPNLTFKGEPKADLTLEDKWGSNRGYFQMPKKGTTAECSRQTTSYNGSNARIVKLTKYDGKTADGSFVTTWEEGFGEKRKMWAAGTFKDAKVVVFKKPEKK